MTGASWTQPTSGLVVLPSGRLVRGRALRERLPPGAAPTYALYLLARRPAPTPWASDWIDWPDFRAPRRRTAAVGLLRQALARADDDRLEVAYTGGRGRTGTALAALVVLDGLEPGAAEVYVRTRYHRRAVETPLQRRWLRTVSR